MAAVSKRQQARNERDLQELLRLPGNTTCADCGARNPGWASWNLGVFLCMRCASLHRKMGTHISKVKSLSMDTWSSEQVDNMKRHGNTVVNKIFNPKNTRPDMPLDADEIDGAMERYIRKKYQEKSLADGRPEPPTRSEYTPPSRAEYSPPVPPKSPEMSPPRLPSKKGRFFGFGLRASSSALPLSRHEKKKLPPQPRVDSAWAIGDEDLRSMRRMSQGQSPLTESELRQKMDQLKDMGFTDSERNASVLRRTSGNVERAIEALVRMGPSPGQRTSSKVTTQETGSSRTNDTTAATTESTQSASRSSGVSNNPFDQLSGQSFGASIAPAPPQQQQPTGGLGSNNPYEQQSRTQPNSGIVGALQGLQLSQYQQQPQQQQQALFPHSTGGYPSQPPPILANRLQSMTPPAPSMAQQYGYLPSPSAMDTSSNPFFQYMQPQQTGSNPFFAQQTQLPSPTMANNPYAAPQPPSQSPSAAFNPFGLPPGASAPQTPQSQPGSNPFQQFMTSSPGQPQSPSLQLPNYQYGQPQMQPQHTAQFQASQNPYAAFSPVQSQAQPPQQFSQFQHSQNPYGAIATQQQMQPQQMPPQLLSQQTGRHDKSSILALYNYPQLAPQKPQLSSIPEPDVGAAHPSTHQQHSPRRSATMPVTFNNMHSAGGAGNFGPGASGTSRNPFMQTQNSASVNPNAHAGPGAGFESQGSVSRHVSQESMGINNLDSGRHSPDVFANLSARYV